MVDVDDFGSMPEPLVRRNARPIQLEGFLVHGQITVARIAVEFPTNNRPRHDPRTKKNGGKWKAQARQFDRRPY